MALSKIRRNFKRFRSDNHYSYPLLFLFIDCLGGLFRVLLICLILGIGWVFFSRFIGIDGDLDNRLSTASLGALPLAASSVDAQMTVEVAEEDKVDLQTPVRQLLDQNWILNKYRGSYTVQVASSESKPELENFAQQFRLDEQLHIYPFKISSAGRPVFGLAFGIYPTFFSANKVAEKLSEPLRENKPWIRPIGNLQDQIIATTEKIESVGAN